ncbi:MAG TPA: DUF1552 domain-containing protein [Vicinamibacterales bacterium]|nr:DUF1552 domain-containing protein [Vicinamibacterales bacterium]
MFISKLSLPRRTFLRGMGVALGLPLLESMVPALSAMSKTAANVKPRLGFVYVPHGVIMDDWTPKTAGADFEFTPILKPLEPYRSALTVVSNLSAPLQNTGSHAAASGSWLTGQAPKRTDGPDFKAGTTIDQIIAQHHGQDTNFPSMEVATEDFTGLVGACDPGYSCNYMNTLVWQNPTTPLPMEINPRVVFDRMFGGGATREERLARIHTDESVLDLVKADLEDLEGGLGAGDRARLDQYLSHVREVERRIQLTEKQADSHLEVPAAPVGIPESFEEHAMILYELMALAFEADLTRVFTFMKAREVSQRTYPQIGVTEPHHSISHHGNKPEKIAGHAKINNYHVGLFAKFVERLRSTPDGDGSLLDHSLILYGSGMSNGNVHSPSPLPLAMVGGLNGRVKGNRHVVLQAQPSANAMLTLAHLYDVPLDSFGASTGPVDL